MDLSFIIPCYNAGLDVLHCVESIENSARYVRHEIIVVDDNSGKETLSILEELSNSSRIILHRNLNNLGAGVCRNIGLSKANGAYLQFIDADDLLCKEAVDDFIENRGLNADVYLFDYRCMRENKIDLVNSTDEIVFHVAEKKDLFYKVLSLDDKLFFLNLTSYIWNKFISRKFAESINLKFSHTPCFNDVFGCWTAMYFCERLVVFNSVGIYYRQHSDLQLSNQHDERRVQSLTVYNDTDKLIPLNSEMRPYYEFEKIKAIHWLNTRNPENLVKGKLDLKDFYYFLDEPFYIYGTGSKAMQFFERLSDTNLVLGFIDSDFTKSSSKLCNKKIHFIDEIVDDYKVVIASSFYREIVDILSSRNIEKYTTIEELPIRLLN